MAQLVCLATAMRLMAGACAASEGAYWPVQGRLSTKTPYSFAKPANQSLDATEGLPPTSKALYLFYLGRHGTRWPTADTVEEIKGLQPLLQASKHSKAAWAEEWSMYTKGQAGQLHSQGVTELRKLGERFAQRFPSLFEQGYRAGQHTFVSTQVTRASASAKAFSQGLFPCTPEAATPDSIHCQSQHIPLSLQPKEDPLLRFYKMCPLYDQYREEVNPLLTLLEALIPSNKSCWKAGPVQEREWTSRCREPVASKVQQRLGSMAGLRVSEEAVCALWKLCQGEAGLMGVTDQACSLFDDEDIALLEYCSDVKHFETHGHSRCRAYQMASTLGADIMAHLRKAVEAHSGSINSTGMDSQKGSEPERARFYFAHDHTIAGLAAWLGLFGSDGACSVDARDSVLKVPFTTALTPPPSDRQWWGSMVAPFAANMAVILHRPALSDRIQARLLWNERAVPIPWCGYQIDCNADDFLDVIDARGNTSIEEACSLYPTL